MSKKILYIVTKSDLGGVTKYLLEIVTHLPKDYEPFFIMSSAGYFSEELKNLGLEKNIFFVPMTNSIINIPLHIKSNLQTIKIINKIKPDIIHCNSTTGGIVGRICGALTFKPVIFTAHGWAFTDGISKGKQIFYKILEESSILRISYEKNDDIIQLLNRCISYALSDKYKLRNMNIVRSFYNFYDDDTYYKLLDKYIKDYDENYSYYE